MPHDARDRRDSLPAPLAALTRRQALGTTAAVVAALLSRARPAASSARAAVTLTPLTTPMSIACFIRYQIDPYQRDAFRTYAEAWGRVIPRAGGHLIGYFLPHEGTNDVAWGLIAFDSLAAYERYRARLRTDAEAMQNFRLAAERRFILRERRTFVEVVAGTFERPSTLDGPA